MWVWQIVRSWALTKETVKGPITINCYQTILVRPIHEYDICFPKDVSSDCKTPIIDTVLTDELGCDILAVNVVDKRYDASDDECYKIFRTYTVINWCAYDDRCGDPMAEEPVCGRERKPCLVGSTIMARIQSTCWFVTAIVTWMKNSGCQKTCRPTMATTFM
nr:hypothetical protein [Haliscomenobacter sp.]